ncbi:hypothetical protein [Kitasatospora sp. GP82]|uniref:hypothetical protein n=1 Tax=Kitasatospora sp. GP82 TaxID=3035089 RepID=UPI0024767373|nr:hypothetical protein [Kitasatospora sp. GP82]MDH6125039.1 hypothetical protein [Kitasatospora sp. GP82]
MTTNSSQIPRGLAALIPHTHKAEGSSGQRAAAQLLGLREVTLPAAVIAAADALLDHALASNDPVTRDAAAATRTRLRAVLGVEDTDG